MDKTQVSHTIKRTIQFYTWTLLEQKEINNEKDQMIATWYNFQQDTEIEYF